MVKVFDPAAQRHEDDAKATAVVHPAAQEAEGKCNRTKPRTRVMPRLRRAARTARIDPLGVCGVPCAAMWRGMLLGGECYWRGGEKCPYEGEMRKQLHQDKSSEQGLNLSRSQD
jgi:hypothetical protein